MASGGEWIILWVSLEEQNARRMRTDCVHEVPHVDKDTSRSQTRGHSCYILEKHLSTFCPCTKNLQETEALRLCHSRDPLTSSVAECDVSGWGLVGSGSLDLSLGKVYSWPWILLCLFSSWLLWEPFPLLFFPRPFLFWRQPIMD